MATHRRRMNHTSCRAKNRGGIGPKGSNSARQTQIAKLNFERWGVLVGRAPGHKPFGWAWNFPDRPWKPLDEKLKDSGGVPLYIQKRLKRK